MKITNKIFNFPPYISTTWSQVKSIYMKDKTLIVVLANQEQISIPNLKSDLIELIFDSYTTYLENEQGESLKASSQGKPSVPLSSLVNTESQLDFPIRFGLNTLDGIGAALQHNPAQMDSPNIPLPVLQKIAAIGKVIAPEDIQSMPKPEPHCNCLHCQIIRAITQGVPSSIPQNDQIVEDQVSEKDLNFQQWDISQSGDKLFTVINRLDTKEKYSVYLGHPIGCTCGKVGCEHVIAVLKS